MFIVLQQNRQYEVSCWEGIGRNLSSADITSIICGGNACFGCAIEFWRLVAGQGTPVVVIERVGRRAIDIL